MQDHSILQMVLGSGPVVQLVLVILIFLSIASWAISIAKYLHLKKAFAESVEFGSIFWDIRDLARIEDSCSRLTHCPLVSVFQSGYKELVRLGKRKDLGNELVFESKATVRTVLENQVLKESQNLEQGQTFLATVSSAAPFIGLFGTVWGIMNAFMGLSQASNSTLQAVAPGISEALIATAIGLAAAIPASIAYNFFSVSVKKMKQQMNQMIDDFLVLAEPYIPEGK
jgi:biopolymer transport protein TolQ